MDTDRTGRIMTTYYSGKGQGAWIKDRLIEEGSNGTTVADLFKERQQNWFELGLPHNGTYNSFAKFFHWYKQLEWVETTGEIEQATPRGMVKEVSYEVHGFIRRYIIKKNSSIEVRGLSPRVYYRITSKGTAENDTNWGNPLLVLHPEWATGGEKRKEYMREYMKDYRRRKKRLLITFGFTPRPRGRPRFSFMER